VLDEPEVRRLVLLCMPEAVEDELCLLEVMEAMRRMLLCMLEAAEGRLYLLKVLEMLGWLEVIRLCATPYAGRLWRVSSVWGRCRRRCAVCCSV